MARLFRWLKSVIIAPKHLAVIGSLLDFTGPRISRKYRTMLFRVFGAMVGASNYRRSGISKLQSILGGLFAGSLYRVKTHGLENLPKGGFLLIANHFSIFDSILLQSICPRPIRFIVKDRFCRNPWLIAVFNLVQAEAIPISSTRSKQALRTAAERIKQGDIVCIFPEGDITQTGVLLRLQEGFRLIARLAECEVVPAWVDGIYGSMFSFEGSRYVFKLPKRIRPSATIAFGRPIQATAASTAFAREKLQELSAFCFEQRSELDLSIGRAAIKSLKHRQFDSAVVEMATGQRLRRGELLAQSIALSRWIKRQCRSERVAVFLPAGAGAFVANVAVTLANKVPVNLNPHVRCAALESAIARNRILHAVSSTRLKRLKDSPSPKHVFLLEEILGTLKANIVFWRITSLVLPAWLLSSLLRLPRNGGQKEALLLFAGNDSGKSAGIVLSHRNVMARVEQLDSMLRIGCQDSLITSPSRFHCFDSVLTLWYPLIEGVRTVNYPKPHVANEEVFAKYAVLIERCRRNSPQIGVDSQGAGRKYGAPKQLESVHILSADSERSPFGRRYGFERNSKTQSFYGYWQPEAASLVSTNLPDPAQIDPCDPFQPAQRGDSVGKLLPGQAAQIRHPETGEVISLHEPGILWLKGANIFEGYFDEPENTAEVLRDGWFQTKHLAWFDEDGFLHLVRRPSPSREKLSKGALTAG
jgi:acyl-[acyl-carrier-protein]-phospholipid O-acyltransferase/long-chain-fatty-acid--[acyl-carrier-protein] ligase